MADQLDQGNAFCPTVLNGISDAIIVIDSELNVVYANRAVQEKAEDPGPIGNKCYRLLHGAERPCTPCPCRQTFTDGKPNRIFRKSEGPDALDFNEFRSYPILDENGRVTQVIEVIQEGLRLEADPEAHAKVEKRPPLLKDEVTSFCGMVGRSKKMAALFEMIRLISPSNATVLIYGESGTGKELVARAIHQSSLRRERPFIAVDCGALTETLLESELFGHLKGSFTGAIQNKKGLFEEAEGGTLFLDEIADTSLAFQSKLLRVLQEGEIRPVGGTRSVKINVRVVAATNKPLKEAIARKTFREDLYYRLAVMPIMISPVRERPDDILLLTRHFVEKYARRSEKGPMRLSDESVKVLLKHPWRGNVRELENVIERAVLVSAGPEILAAALLIGEEALSGDNTPAVPFSAAMDEVLSRVEKERIVEALLKSNGNRSSAARALGISRSNFYKKMKLYRI